MLPTLEDTADRINQAFRRYGLTHDVVVVEGMDLQARLLLVDGDDPGTMHNLAFTLEHLCSLAPEDAQLRLF